MASRRERTSSKKDPYLGKVIAGRYRLETRLGEGGMGVVYRARHVLIDRVVALKLIRPDLKGETHLRAWMLREARAANRVDHAHIVQIYDVGETDESELYLVMEYLVGTSLSAEIAKNSMSFARAVDIVEQMCAALSRAHDLGVIHRDLKSENVMITMGASRRDFIKILDFGLAALTRDPRLAPKGAVFGTPEYMSPEQARGDDATAQSDLYSLGVLFFELITGQLPFKSNDRETLLEMQRTQQAPRPRNLRPDLPQPAEDVILKLLEKDPKNRYRDGHHLHEELKTLQRALPATPWEVNSDAPVVAPPPPPAPSAGVVEWGTRAANFARLLARAYPHGGIPEALADAESVMWGLAAKASKLEGELSTLSRNLDAMEKRGRGVRAEIGRKVEELAAEESRALREAASERRRFPESKAIESQKRAIEARRRATDAEQNGTKLNVSVLRAIFEEAGAAEAHLEATRQLHQHYEKRALRREQTAGDLRQQINELRAQLKSYSESLESELAGGRNEITARAQRALQFEKEFAEATHVLLSHLKDRPECRDLLEELARESSIVVEAPDSMKATPTEVTPGQVQVAQ